MTKYSSGFQPKWTAGKNPYQLINKTTSVPNKLYANEAWPRYNYYENVSGLGI